MDSEHMLVGPVALGKKDEHVQLHRGTTIGRYVILDQLGTGGMGVVYKAYDPDLDRSVAVKLLKTTRKGPAAEARESDRMLREAQALARLNHPNVVSVHDVGTVDNNVFVAMELVEGQTLSEWFMANTPSRAVALEVMTAAGRGLYAAHKAGLVHRDFKPANVIVGQDGVPRVIDFGLARAGGDPTAVGETTPLDGGEPWTRETREVQRSDPGSGELEGKTRCSTIDLTAVGETTPLDGGEPWTRETREVQRSDPGSWEVDEKTPCSSRRLLDVRVTRYGSTVGTPFYMAPEQLLQPEVDARADQYSFCVVLCEALYSASPFTRQSMKKLGEHRKRGELKTADPDREVPSWLEAIVRRGLSEAPSERFESMQELLEALADDPVVAEQQRRLARRRAGIAALFVLVAMSLPVGVWYEFAVRRSVLCKGAETHVAKAWNPKIKAAVRDGLVATGVPYAKDTAERVGRGFDAYAEAWVNMFTETCRATNVSGSQSPEIMDARMMCLTRRLKELDALANILKQADAKVVEKATQAVGGLSPIDECADVAILMTPKKRIKPPDDEETERRVETLREKFAVVRGLIAAGKYAEGLELAEATLVEAKALDYPPVESEALALVGHAQERAGKYKAAAVTLEAAIMKASISHDGKTAAHAIANLVFVVGERLFDPKGALQWAQLGEFAEYDSPVTALNRGKRFHAMGTAFRVLAEYDKALEYHRQALAVYEKSLGPEHPFVANQINSRGVVFHWQGEYEKALEHYRQALAIFEKSLGPEHPRVAYALNNSGVAFQKQGEYEKALAYYRQALAILQKSLGPEHPDVANALNNVGVIFYYQGEYEKALEYLAKSLDLSERALGSEHPMVAEPLSGMGAVLVDQRRPEEAIELLERAVSICEKRTCDPEIHGRALFALARGLAATKGDMKRAQKLAKQARDIFNRTPKRFRKELQEVNPWLAERGER